MSLSGYLEREGLDPDVDPADLSVMEAAERVAEEAYYKACLSDSTYHGVNHSGKVDHITGVVKSDRYPQFGTDDFAMLDRLADKLIGERRSG